MRKRKIENSTLVSYQKFVDAFILFLALWTIGGPEHSFVYSATATLAFLCGLTMFIALLRYRKRDSMPGRQLLTALAVLIMLYGTFTPMIGKLSLIDVSSAVGRDETLKGRTDVWRELVPAAMERPILGYGYGGFWTSEARDEFDITDSHNGYLNLILNVGFIGLVLYGMFILSSIRKAHRMLTQDFDWGALWICCMVMGLLVNIAEVSFSSLTDRIMAVILFLTVSSAATTSNTREPR